MSVIVSPVKPCVSLKLHCPSMDSCPPDNSFADYLPWNDVIFQHILPHLDLTSILALHSVNTTYRQLVQSYQYYVKSFDVCEARDMTREQFIQVTSGMRSLRALALGPCTWITDRLAVDLIMENSCLEWISLANAPCLTNATVLKIAAYCRQLQGLNLTGSGVTVDVVRSLVRRCPRIQVLDLTRCIKVDDQAMACLAGGAKLLQSVNICGCVRVTDVGVAHLTLLPRLRHINVRGTNVTDNAVKLMARHLPTLTHVDISDCRKVTARSLARLKALNPRVELDVWVKYCHSNRSM